MKNRAFTLVELLVVVLIIGILAAIAVPQYQQAVMKSNLSRGISLVESLYQAQQSYYLTHGKFATNIDDLDVSIPKDKSCTKTQIVGNYGSSKYKCNFGTIGIFDGATNAQYQPNGVLAYVHYFKNKTISGYTLKEGKRYCFAWPTNKHAMRICESIGGVEVSRPSGSWVKYEIM